MRIEEVSPLVAIYKEAHAVYIAPQDNLRILSWNASSTVTAIAISGRFLTPAGNVVDIQERHVPTSDRAVTTSLAVLGEGWLLDLSIVATGSPLIGQTFVRAEIVRGLTGAVTSLKVLAQGFCNAAQRLAWPGSALITTMERPGAIRSVTGTNPSAGGEVFETVPAGARWRLLATAIPLTTSATVANRFPQLQFDDGSSTYLSPGVSAAIAASTSVILTAGDIGAAQSPTPFGLTVPIPANAQLLAGHRIRTLTTNLQAGDDYGAPQMLIEEWLEGAA